MGLFSQSAEVNALQKEILRQQHDQLETKRELQSTNRELDSVKLALDHLRRDLNLLKSEQAKLTIANQDLEERLRQLRKEMCIVWNGQRAPQIAEKLRSYLSYLKRRQREEQLYAGAGTTPPSRLQIHAAVRESEKQGLVETILQWSGWWRAPNKEGGYNVSYRDNVSTEEEFQINVKEERKRVDNQNIDIVWHYNRGDPALAAEPIDLAEKFEIDEKGWRQYL